LQPVEDVAFGLQCRAKVPLDFRPRLFGADELDAIAVPVLYIAGENEKLASVPAAVARLAREAPRIETAVFPAAGHDLISLQPEAVAARMLQFLDARSA
jgi:pimeloyl-ACP methyl ester carboxylesterase